MASIPLSLLLHFDINNTLGAIYLGSVFVGIFFGITSIQAITYFKRNSDDKWSYKLAVAVLWLIDALHLACIVHAGYHYAVSNYGNTLAMLNVTWSLIGQIILTTMSDAIVRIIFAHRVWLLSGGNVFVMLLIAVTSCAVFAGGMLFAGKAAEFRDFTRLSEFSWILYFSLSALAVADIIISTSLCILLKKQGSLALSRTRSIVRTLMMYSINGSALTSLCAVICLVTYATMNTNFIFEAFYFILPKLYLNSLLATLNARASLRQTLTSTDLVSLPLSKATVTQGSLTTSPKRQSSRRSQRTVDRETIVNIHVETTTMTSTDHRDGFDCDRKYDIESLPYDNSKRASTSEEPDSPIRGNERLSVRFDPPADAQPPKDDNPVSRSASFRQSSVFEKWSAI